MGRNKAKWIEELAKLKQKSITREEIANRYGLDKTTVSRVMKNNGIEGYYTTGDSGRPVRQYDISEVRKVVKQRAK